MTRRKLPLVLDLDDTLVRYLPDPEMAEYIKKTPHRVKTLRDGRKIVLVEKVHEFLDWAQRYFEISICTIGDQNYLEMVLQILDPNRTRIKGTIYSARYEYESILRSSNPQRPAKDLGSLFSYCVTRNENRNQPGTGNSLPLILDDNITAWPIEQHDNIIVVRETRNSPLWNVSLYPVVQNTLQAVYTSFFKQLDMYSTGQTKVFPSCVRCYKEYLRWELSQRISEPFIAYPPKNIPPPGYQPPPSSQPPTSQQQQQQTSQSTLSHPAQSTQQPPQSQSQPPSSQQPPNIQFQNQQPYHQPISSQTRGIPPKNMQQMYKNYNTPTSQQSTQQQIPRII